MHICCSVQQDESTARYINCTDGLIMIIQSSSGGDTWSRGTVLYITVYGLTLLYDGSRVDQPVYYP